MATLRLTLAGADRRNCRLRRVLCSTARGTFSDMKALRVDPLIEARTVL